MDYVLQLVEQLLGAADAECGDEYGAAVGQGMFQHPLKALAAAAAVFMQAVAVGTFQHYGIGAPGVAGGRQQGRVRGAQVAGKDDPFAAVFVGVMYVAFDPGRTQDMPGRLEADAAAQVVPPNHFNPLSIGLATQHRLNHANKPAGQLPVTLHAHQEGILQHGGHQHGRRLGTVHRPLEAGSNQPGQAADMVDVDVGGDQGLDAVEFEFDGQAMGSSSLNGAFHALKQTAVDQQTVFGAQPELMAGAGNALRGAVMLDEGVSGCHAGHSLCVVGERQVYVITPCRRVRQCTLCRFGMSANTGYHVAPELQQATGRGQEHLMFSYRLWTVITTAALLQACALAPGLHQPAVSQMDAEAQIISIDQALIQQQASPAQAQLPQELLQAEPQPYRLGPLDELYITVWDYPELTVPGGAEQQGGVNVRAVDANGVLFFPFVGQIRASGLTPAQLRHALTEQLSRFIDNPQVDVRLAQANSRRVLLGPGFSGRASLSLPGQPLSLHEALLELDYQAKPRSLLTLTRDNTRYELPAEAVQSAGAAQLFLRAGDLLNLEHLEYKPVTVLGEVQSPRQLGSEHNLTLLQALMSAGGLRQDAADPRAIWVMRDAGEYTQRFHLDASAPEALLLAGDFRLEAGDLVFVGATGLTRWNRTISQMLPTLSRQEVIVPVDDIRSNDD